MLDAESLLDDGPAEIAADAGASTSVTAIAKAIGDLDDLVRLLVKGLSPAKTWQRGLSIRLGRIDGLLQVLRMTIVLERSNAEVISAADVLYGECSGLGIALVGSRADRTTKAAVNLVARLAAQIRDTLGVFSQSRAERSATEIP